MLQSTIIPNPPSSNQVAFAFLFFFLSLSWAVFSALGEPELHYARTVRLIWVSLIFACFAVVAFGMSAGITPLNNYWRLSWTCSFALYLVHFLYGFIVVHSANVGSVYAHQGAIIATANFFLTGVWSYDVFRSWYKPASNRSVERFVAHIIVVLGFLIATLVFGSITAKWLGALMVISLVIAAVMRFQKRAV